MARRKLKNPEEYIVPLYMNGLQGRMLHIPAPRGKKREILFVYGHHSSLERWWGVVHDLSQYGAVTMPDLPGFGGMQSFYKLGEKPTIDNLADYLAAFMKLRFKRKKVVIAGLSFGFVVATRMLQRYPELTKNVELLVSVVGFTHKDDFTFSKPRYWWYRSLAWFFSGRLRSFIFKGIFLHPLVIRLAYARTHNAKQKFKPLSSADRHRIMNFEIGLWHSNDVRTHMLTTREFLRLNNCDKRVNLPVWHISVKNDRYFDNHIIEQHMRVVFSDYHGALSTMGTHAPSVIADAQTAAPLLPRKIRQLLSRDTQ